MLNPWDGGRIGNALGDGGSRVFRRCERPGFGGLGRGAQPRREGRAESVPEAGGTGAEAVATPDHAARRSLRGLTREIDGRDRAG